MQANEDLGFCRTEMGPTDQGQNYSLERGSDQQSLKGDLMCGYMNPGRFNPELGTLKIPGSIWLLEGNPIEA